jgi:divalent metal cation (Fe/Co/Zn/Cd) transporter
MKRTHLLRRGVRLEALTIAWNVIEAAVAIGAGWLAGSVALIGFGIDSIIETIAATALFRRLRAELGGASAEESEAHERRALRVVGVTFFALALYILYESGSSLWMHRSPEPSRVGIGLSLLSLAVMPLLAFAKLKTGRALDSAALIADSKETFACAYLSLVLLLGLGANAAFGAWWADPVAGLLMVPWIVREGYEALEEAGGE